jgi:hypothetical protein
MLIKSIICILLSIHNVNSDFPIYVDFVSAVGQYNILNKIRASKRHSGHKWRTLKFYT